MRKTNALAALIFVAVFGIGGGFAYIMSGAVNMGSLSMGIGAFVIALVVSSSVQVADQWERA